MRSPLLCTDRRPNLGPKISPDARLEFVGRDRQFRDGAAGAPLDELRALNIHAKAAVWGTHDWYDMFMGSVKITHVTGLEMPGESVLDALKLSQE
ncbi:MAG: hypothetical protein JWL97_4421 [Gemmatimonadales bacterium]|jgi:hypothetical protein|nr:hypothetical protein [Gemmatimonadales bacterium]